MIETWCVRSKVMVFPHSGIDRSPHTVASTAAKRTDGYRMHHRHGGGPDLQRQPQSGCARAGSERNSYRIGTIAWTHFALTSLRPGHTRVSPLLQRTKGSQPDGPDVHPLVRALALHGVSGESPKATWAQPLSREELS
jgi:hypothetical protein